MSKTIKTKACGATGLADALGAALERKLHIDVLAPSTYRGKSVQTQNLPRIAPNPLVERRKREENAQRITKHSAMIKRLDPRLLQELLQEFGSIEGLSAPRQEELIKRLEKIRREYHI